jgi:hypothetical protein
MPICRKHRRGHDICDLTVNSCNQNDFETRYATRREGRHESDGEMLLR